MRDWETKIRNLASISDVDVEVDTLINYINTNWGEIQQLIQSRVNSKRADYDVHEKFIIDFLIVMCNYGCSKAYVNAVNNIMTLIGYPNYSTDKKRFRQRTENKLRDIRKENSNFHPSSRRRPGNSRVPELSQSTPMTISSPEITPADVPSSSTTTTTTTTTTQMPTQMPMQIAEDELMKRDNNYSSKQIDNLPPYNEYILDQGSGFTYRRNIILIASHPVYI